MHSSAAGMVAWTRWRYRTPQRAPGEAPYVRAVSRLVFDCDLRRIAILASTRYGGDGAVTGSYSAPGAADADDSTRAAAAVNAPEGTHFEAVVPDSRGEAALDAVCGPGLAGRR